MVPKMSLRSLVLVVLLGVCVAEAMKFPGLKSKKTKEETEEEKRLKAAKLAYKDLFVHSGTKLTRDEISERLNALDHYYGSPDDMPVDFRILMKYNQTEEANCDDRQYVEGLNRLVRMTRKEYKPLREYVEGCFKRQLEVCDYENRFKRIVEMFKREEADKWELIQDYNYAVAQHGKRMYYWNGKNIDNSRPLNEALEEMFEEKVRSGQWDQYETSQKLQNVARELVAACKLFEQRLGSSLTMTTLNPNIKKNEEMLEWLRYLNVCGQVYRVNFDRAIGDMFGKYHLPEIQAERQK